MIRFSALTTPVDTPTLVMGDSGDAVIQLQKQLEKWSVFSGYYRKDGIDSQNGQFDVVVKLAVEQFQAAMFLQPDGVVGYLTWQALFQGSPVNMPVLRYGDVGVEVMRLQQILVDIHGRSHHLSNEGIFDTATNEAVQMVQKRAGLTPDGIVNAQTWCALSRALASSRSH